MSEMRPTDESSTTPMYKDDFVRIYHGDAANLDFLPDASIQLVVTSPPYNLGKDYGKARDDVTYQQYFSWVR